MTDIALVWQDGSGAIVQQGADLLTDDSLATAVVISLFTDRRALLSDPLAEGEERRGWWADSYRARPIGSRLWLLGREKQMREVRQRAEQYAAEALAWLREDGLVRAVDVVASNPVEGVLRLTIRLTLPDGSPLPFSFTTRLRSL
ncbi:hypothetical protein AN401_11770 [Zobellella denitrificans]|uniref:Uncharacterized protein n=1 Tax=Zobellella denitrificans TaxID=347534 RepID=A0A291HQB7_9GAMM|nr:phage GP46 family protein [Zobellella denitrificans]ATG74322.1 hypothetical protein AN401_10990 [Zobellella denitrificans]ATG74448.1 hypothetical protein AN401_11770 [Zobellella denitrificans]